MKRMFRLLCYDKILKPVTHGLHALTIVVEAFPAVTMPSIFNVIISVKLVIVLIGRR